MPEEDLNGILWQISNLTHLPREVRDHLTNQASFARSVAEKETLYFPEFLRLYQELLQRIHLLLLFAAEHQRLDTRETLDLILKDLSGLLLPKVGNGLTIFFYLDEVKKVFLRVEQITGHFFNQMLVRYELDLNKLIAKTKMVAAVSPLQDHFKNSRIIQDFEENCKRKAQFTREALAWLKKLPPKDKFCQQWQWFWRLDRKYELAKYFALGVETKEPLREVGTIAKSVLEKGNALERMNNLGHFFQGPKPEPEALLTQGDAMVFYAYVRKLLEKGASLPQFLKVVEFGGGDGQFAAAFLTQIAFLDLEQNATHPGKPLIYPRIRYVLVDCSSMGFEKAQANPELMKHEASLVFSQIKPEEIFSWKEPIFYARFREFFEDSSRTPILYKDSKGSFHELRVTLTTRKDGVVRSPDYGQGDEKRWERILQGKEVMDPQSFHSSNAEALGLQYHLYPLEINQVPFGREVEEIAKGFFDGLFSVSLGAAEILQKVATVLVPNFGYAHVFDFGYDRLTELHHRQYYYASQIARRFGFKITHDLSFPLLGLLAKHLGMKTALFLQEDLIEKVTKKPVLDTSAFVPHYCGRTLIRHVSIENGIFHLSFLRFFESIVSCQKTGKRRERKFDRFIAHLRDKGYLGYGPKISYLEAARDDVENLGLELDFWVNGLYRALVGKGELRWLPLRIPLIEQALEEAGFDVNRLMAQVHRNPYYAAFRVFRMRK